MVNEPRKTKRMLEVEKMLGKPLEVALKEDYNRLGDLVKVAEEWNKKLDGEKVNYNLLWYWMLRLDLRLVISKRVE